MSSEQTIADLAYALWQARGCPEGSADVDWAEAERQVLAAGPNNMNRVSIATPVTESGELL